MESKKAIFFTIFFIFSLVSLPIIHITTTPNITAIFAFGDSTIDSGNNNHITTIFRSDHQPYGQDLPGHVSSGRFSNGKLATDYMVASLGLKERFGFFSENSYLLFFFLFFCVSIFLLT